MVIPVKNNGGEDTLEAFEERMRQRAIRRANDPDYQRRLEARKTRARVAKIWRGIYEVDSRPEEMKFIGFE